ncbi:hypothetical protein GCM10022251_31780 [Phytohabitans flavus]
MHRPPRAATALLSLAMAVTMTAATASSPAAATPRHKPPVIDLERVTGLQLQAMMDAGKLTSVELTKMYLDRINALNKSGPGLNAVTQLNKNALAEAAYYDKLRAKGIKLSPAMGLPVLMKDLIDVKGMYTSAGNFSLRNSYPAEDAGLVKKLRANGVVILGKLGLSEYANFFGSQPSGFANLTGQVVNAVDADQNPSGSSSGSGAAAAASLATLVVGTETSGSIISPSSTQGIVGLRPTVGLVPGYGIAPISASQDTAGPMVGTVSDAALLLQTMSGYDPENEAYYAGIWGPGVNDTDIIPPVPHELPNYLSALDANFVRGKRIGYNGTLTEGTPLKIAYDALVQAGAIMVERPVISPPGVPGSVLSWEAHRDIDHYYQHLGPQAPINSLAEEVAVNQSEEHQALKFGNGTHQSALAQDINPDSAASVQYRNNLVVGKQLSHQGIDRMMTNDTPDDSTDDFIAILGSVSNGARAGYPQITVPMGYNSTTRRTVNVNVHGGAYDERDILGVAYVIEQATKLRQTPGMVNPSMYRCAQTVPAQPFAKRGDCNPTYDQVMRMLGGRPAPLAFSLETETAASLRTKLLDGKISAVDLTRAYLYRIGLTNAEGPATQAVRDLNWDVLKEAKEADKVLKKYRDDKKHGKKPKAPGPLLGLPVLLDDSFDTASMATTGGSIALQDLKPAKDSTVVAKLEAAGALILGKTNVSELNGVFSSNMPKGYSSLGGQVLLPSDTDKTPAGSSGGSAAATASGLAALTIGMETSTDTAQLLAPADAAGVVGLKPTVGLVSRTGVLPVAKSQDSPGPLTRSVYDAGMTLNVLVGKDRSDPASTAPPVADYTAGLTPNALVGKRIAVISSTTGPYPAMVSALQAAGATTVPVTIGPAPATPSIVQTEFKRDLDAYLGGRFAKGSKAPESLQEIIAYNDAHPVEGLKYQQTQLVANQAVDLTDPATLATYTADLAAGKTASQAVIDTVLNNGTPADPSDDFDAVLVPTSNALINVADRAGYPALTIPAGYGTGSAGRNPIGVTLVGTAYSEAKLLAGGYALEQATQVRLAPSWTNPSMWRCVPGSTFFTGQFCNPGDRLLRK